MPRRQWDANTNAMLVIEGLKGKPVAELCTAHQSSQAQYDQWREQLLAHAPKAFEAHAPSQREARLAREHARLKPLVGARTLERHQSDAVLGGVGKRLCGSCRATTGCSNASKP